MMLRVMTMVMVVVMTMVMVVVMTMLMLMVMVLKEQVHTLGVKMMANTHPLGLALMTNRYTLNTPRGYKSHVCGHLSGQRPRDRTRAPPPVCGSWMGKIPCVSTRRR